MKTRKRTPGLIDLPAAMLPALVLVGMVVATLYRYVMV